MTTFRRSDFPADFRWGVSTSAFQIEGATDIDGRGPSIWDDFTRVPGAIRNGDTADRACDHYHRLDEDLGLLSRLGVGAYRFSVAWPRVVPEGRGAVNAAGLDFYERLVDGLLARGIEPWATLYHWDLPSALERAGGWPERATVDAFVDYADVVSRRLGDRVKRWITHNEPWCAAFKGYMEGVFAPGRRDWAAAAAAGHHILLSHGAALPVLRANAAGARCGLSLVLNAARAASDSDADRAALVRQDGLNVRWYMDPLYGRGYPADITAALGAAAPPVRDGDLEVIAAPTDFLGVNYYFNEVVADDPRSSAPVRWKIVEEAGVERTGFGWEVHPAGLTELLVRLHRDWGAGPIAITENGATYPDVVGPDGRIDDLARLSYIRRHIDAVRAARARGVAVEAHFVWSLLDNFEWAEGYDKRFGLFHVDFATGERRIKRSGEWFSEFLTGAAGPGPIGGPAR
jgi:beta-glucosidase